MKEFMFNGITVNHFDDECTRELAEKYLKYVETNKEYAEAKIKHIKITDAGNDDVNINVEFIQDLPKIERIRRITGYLTGSLDTWNNAKQKEESDRVKHA